MDAENTRQTTLSRLVAEEIVVRGILNLGIVKASESPHGTKPEPTSNDHHAAESIIRMAQLIGVGNWMQQEIVGPRLNALKDELVSEIRQDKPTAASADKLFANAQKRILNAFTDIKGKLLSELTTVAGAIEDRQRSSLAKHHGLAAGKLPALNLDAMHVAGLTIGETLSKFASDLFTRFKAQIRMGLANGDTVEELCERIEGTEGIVKAGDFEPHVHAAAPLEIVASLLDTTANSFSAMIQAAIRAAATAVENGLFDDLDDDDENAPTMGLVWTTAGEGVCERCEIYDGEKWDADLNPLGDSPPYPGDPPDSQHLHCRCSVVEFDMDKPDGIKGKKIDDYFRESKPEVLSASFGKANARAFLNGDITGRELMKSDRILSPEDFKALTPFREAYIRSLK